MTVMLFWSWAKVVKLAHTLSFADSSLDQQLEDRFDSANRRDPRHFVIEGEKSVVTIPAYKRPRTITSDNDGFEEVESVQDQYHCLARDKTAR